jgi:hypothetical protein
LELKKHNDELLRENEELKKGQAQAIEEDLEKNAQVDWRLEKVASRLREERALRKDACTDNKGLEMRLAKLKEELADTKLSLRHETEDHKSTYSALYQHMRSCPEAEKIVESVKKTRATKERLREYREYREYVLPYYSRTTEDEWNRAEEACDPIHDRFHDYDDQEDFLL